MPRELFRDDYEILGDLCYDGRSRMLRARERASGTAVTIYLLRAGAPASAARQFRREQRIRRRLDHGNILAALACGERDGRLFIVEEHVGDETWRDCLREPVDAERALALTEQVCLGLEHIHSAGIVHCDLGPAQIVVSADESAKIGGWSRAIDVNRPGEADEVVIGAIGYLSPEQLQGARAESATDIYALGVMLFEALTGAPPFDSDSFAAVARAHVEETPPSLEKRCPGASLQLVALVGSMLAKRPGDRPTASEVARTCAAAIRS